MNGKELQAWINSKGGAIAVDGQPGPATRDALKAIFVNKAAAAVTDEDMRALAQGLGCSVNQLKAVAEVESGGSGFDGNGRPKMLFERHKFSKWTGGKYDTTSWSNPSGGGYNEDSWEKLAQAACRDAEAAFRSASWGKFQVLGEWGAWCGFASAADMAFSCTGGEAAHYALFVGYVDKVANLRGALRAVSTNADDCRAFAKGYNGPGYEQFDYHTKIAAAFGRLGG